MSSRECTTDIYQRVTDRLIELMEKGDGQWSKPWADVTASGLPVNLASRKSYRGINTMILWSEAMEKGYASNVWGTFNQWKEVGASVKKGEKSACVVFWKFWDQSGAGETEDSSGDEVESTRRCMARAYHVFNVSQVDNAPASIPVVDVPKFDTERMTGIDAFVSATGATIAHDGGNRAYYRPSTDSIHMPAFNRFPVAVSYYSVLLHELTHWTGAESRLHRKKDLCKRFGEENYAMEELVAELGSAYLCASLGVTLEPREDHAQYLASWLKALKNDKRAIFTAASKAQAAADMLHGFSSVSQVKEIAA